MTSSCWNNLIEKACDYFQIQNEEPTTTKEANAILKDHGTDWTERNHGQTIQISSALSSFFNYSTAHYQKQINGYSTDLKILDLKENLIIPSLFQSPINDKFDVISIKDSLSFCNPSAIATILKNAFASLREDGILMGNFLVFLDKWDFVQKIIFGYPLNIQGAWITTPTTIKLVVADIFKNYKILFDEQDSGSITFTVQKK